MSTILAFPVLDDCHQDIGVLVQKRFAESDYHSLRRVKCDVNNGRLTLRGKVPPYLFDQVARTVLDALAVLESD